MLSDLKWFLSLGRAEKRKNRSSHILTGEAKSPSSPSPQTPSFTHATSRSADTSNAVKFLWLHCNGELNAIMSTLLVAYLFTLYAELGRLSVFAIMAAIHESTFILGNKLADWTGLIATIQSTGSTIRQLRILLLLGGIAACLSWVSYLLSVFVSASLDQHVSLMLLSRVLLGLSGVQQIAALEFVRLRHRSLAADGDNSNSLLQSQSLSLSTVHPRVDNMTIISTDISHSWARFAAGPVLSFILIALVPTLQMPPVFSSSIPLSWEKFRVAVDAAPLFNFYSASGFVGLALSLVSFASSCAFLYLHSDIHVPGGACTKADAVSGGDGETDAYVDADAEAEAEADEVYHARAEITLAGGRNRWRTGAELCDVEGNCASSQRTELTCDEADGGCAILTQSDQWERVRLVCISKPVPPVPARAATQAGTACRRGSTGTFCDAHANLTAHEALLLIADVLVQCSFWAFIWTAPAWYRGTYATTEIYMPITIGLCVGAIFPQKYLHHMLFSHFRCPASSAFAAEYTSCCLGCVLLCVGFLMLATQKTEESSSSASEPSRAFVNSSCALFGLGAALCLPVSAALIRSFAFAYGRSTSAFSRRCRSYITISAFSRFVGIMFIGSMISTDGGRGYGKMKSLYTMALVLASVVMVAFAVVVVAGTRKMPTPFMTASTQVPRSLCQILERESYDENIM